jgi:beta-lactamase class A
VRTHARRAVARLERHQPDHAISVAAVNTVSHARFAIGPRAGMWTASAYKLIVLAALLVRTGGELSADEISDATRAIENSDNAAGYRLFLDVGGSPGLADGARKLGMVHTVPGQSDPTFTTTGARDCLALLADLIHRGPLNGHSRAFALELMRNVEADQRWGVGVAADPGTSFANKNGWLSVDDTNALDEDDDGRWIATSLGIVRIRGDRVLMAVLTQHQPSFDAGVHLVQHLARAIAPAVARR